MKILLLSILSFVPIAFAIFQSVRRMETLRTLKQLERLFDRIKRVNTAHPTEAITLFSVLSDCNIADMFCRDVVQQLNGAQSFDDAWLYAIEKLNLCCDYDAKHELICFSGIFSTSSLQDQFDLCERCQQLCTDEINRIELFMNKNNKLMLSGSVLFGALVFITFV